MRETHLVEENAVRRCLVIIKHIWFERMGRRGYSE